MERLARVVVPGIAHHLTLRGNRRQETFFCDEDHETYLALMAEWCGERRVDVWAYCLMPNHGRAGRKPKAKRQASFRTKANEK